MQVVRTGNINVHYVLEGPAGAPVIMFLNALGTDVRVWEKVAGALSTDFRVLRYDKRGHGLTDVTAGPYTMRELADDALGLLNVLGLDRVHLCGASIGGMIAQQMAGTHAERFDRLVLCDTTQRVSAPATYYERGLQVRRDGLAAVADGAMERWFTEPFRRTAAVAAYRNMVARTPVEGYAACCDAIGGMDLAPAVSAIQAPALVLVGEDDTTTPPESARELEQALKDASMQVIPGAAHLACVEQSDSVARLIRGFLERS